MEARYESNILLKLQILASLDIANYISTAEFLLIIANKTFTSST